MRAPVLPRPLPGQDWQGWAEAFVSAAERAIAQSPQGRPYSVSGPVVQRALNVSAPTAANVAQVLGTLISDLKAGSSIA